MSLEVKKEQLDFALAAWIVSRDKLLKELILWREVLQSYDTVINSLRICGHEGIRAKAEIDHFSKIHKYHLGILMESESATCDEYEKLYNEFNQISSPVRAIAFKST